ncbi:helix-turn-helix domain-containing protein [Bailinhaonella thermotolerans]|uniref:XRE family transcriptional regulator n=1 Tax=Bailinhaonella thermotolerans TaxID=1070861 RepID=A0A3A4ANZ4_9ACTN|nr:helix-turn-helix transcriptional regulator [Bailinhaonella thermotolerans]RJL23058.1 XRE family transcriptional regulator [Bailinhaonella thermotolerans]
MTLDDPREELAAFLRHRRAQVSPEQVGLPRSGGRRVPGLRREELAIVAGVSPDHYQRIEQGRVRPSAQVLDAIATALALDDVERAHLHTLAENLRAPLAIRPGARRSDPKMRGLKDLLESFSGPAFALNHCRDVLAWNRLGAALVTDFASLPAQDRNMVWLMLTDPRMRDLYADWRTGAQEQVAMLRRAGGQHPGDPRIERLVGRLGTASPEFVQWWPDRRVHEKTAGTKTLNHPVIGPITLDFHVLRPAATPDIELFVYYPTTPEARNLLLELARRSPTASRAPAP